MLNPVLSFFGKHTKQITIDPDKMASDEVIVSRSTPFSTSPRRHTRKRNLCLRMTKDQGGVQYINYKLYSARQGLRRIVSRLIYQFLIELGNYSGRQKKPGRDEQNVTSSQGSFCAYRFYAKKQKNAFTYFSRTLDKSAYQPRHMFWVLKRTVSMRRPF